MNWLRALPLVLILGAVYFFLAMASPRLRIEVPGRFVTGPASVWAVVRLEPDKQDRWLDVIADGTIYRSIGYTLNGEKSFRIKQVLFKDLPAGCYDFATEVRQVDQEGPIVARTVTSQPLTVLGPLVDATTCSPVE
jgi:hypothetical protein